MPYVGRGLTTGAQYQKLDAIAINNATTFTMSVGSANVSPDQNHLILVVNGVIQEPGTGFTVSGSTCTLASAITTSGHSGTDTIYGVIAGDAAFAAYDSIGANALGVTAGTVTASRAVVPDSNKDIASFRNVTLTGELDAATLDISGNADIDGTTNLDAVDIDGAVQIDSTVTVGADDQGYDVKFFGDTASAYMLWDTSADDLVLAGAAGIDLAGDLDVDGTANLDAVDIDGAVNMAADLTMGANILMADDTSIGIADDAERIEFDGAGDISVLGANFGIGTTAIPHGGIGGANFAIDATNPRIQITDSDDDYPVWQFYSGSHDDTSLGFDIYNDNGTWKSSDAGSNFLLYKVADTIKFMYDSGIAQGSTVSLNNGLVLTATGNVGIGTASPDGTLHAHTASAGSVTAHSQADDLVVENSTTGGISILTPDANSALIRFGSPSNNNYTALSTNYGSGSPTLEFTLLDDSKMVIKSDGNVGIGTSTINRTAYASGHTVLTVEGVGAQKIGVLELVGDDANGNDEQFGAVQFVNMSGNDTVTAQAAIYAARESSTTNSYMAFATEADSASLAEKMRITSTGNVGIGTASPNGVLDLTKDQSRTALTGTTVGLLHLDGGTDDGSGGNGDVTAITFTGRHTAGTVSAIIANELDTDGSHLYFGTSNAYASGVTNSAMTITPAGNVGIGTTSPEYASDQHNALHVLTVGGSSANNYGSIEIAGNETTDNDTVGFLKFVNSNNADSSAATDANLGGLRMLIETSDANAGDDSGGHLVFLTKPEAGGVAERLRIDSSGNVIMQATKKLYLDGGGNSYISEIAGDDIDIVAGGNQSIQIRGANTTFAGSISKGSGSFKIDHPLPSKKDTHYLVHSFTESPRADLIYRDKVTLINGSATVNLDTVAGMTEGTFVLLCDNVQCFTSNESDWKAVKGSVSGNILTIECEDSSSTADISWMVVGDRKDQHIMDTDWTDENGKPLIEPEKENA